MRANRGFTMLEMAVTIAIVGILAALAFPTMRAARRNATVQGSAFDLVLKLDGLRARAMRDQQELLAIVLDAPKNDPTQCGKGSSLEADCVTYYLVAPKDGFVLNKFVPDPLVNATYVDHSVLGRGLKFYLPAKDRKAPPPFGAIAALDTELVGDCSGRACVGVRFHPDGEVAPEVPDGTTAVATKAGFALVLGTDVASESAGSDQRGIVVTFPTGIVRSYSVAR